MDVNKKDGYIMVIEDDKLLLEAIEEKLSKENLAHKCFLEGTEAMKALIDKGERPSLIWLDFYLGDTNGLSLVKILKQNKELSEIPVLVVSNSTGADKIQSLMDLGVVDYLVKANYSLKEIVERIKDILAQKK